MFVYRQSLGVAGAYTFGMRRRCLWVLWISTHCTSTTRLGCPAWPRRRKQLGQLSSSWRALGHAAVPVLHLVPRLTSSELGSFLSQSILFLSRRGAAWRLCCCMIQELLTALGSGSGELTPLWLLSVKSRCWMQHSRYNRNPATEKQFLSYSLKTYLKGHREKGSSRHST